MHRILIVIIANFFCIYTIIAQTIDVNVITYNLLNYPNGNNSTLDGDDARTVYFRQIVEDMDADIIIVQEFMTPNGNSAEGIANADILLNELNNNGVLGKSYAHAPMYVGYGSQSFGHIGNMLFYNSDLFNFESQNIVPAVNTATANNGNTVSTPRPADHYQLSYPKIPSCPAQIATIDIFSAHLKAGFDSASFSQISDEERRNLGALDIIDFISSNLTSTDNIIVGGDFNFQGDFESGYITLLNGVNGAFVDPLNGWVRNVSSQVSKYTQSTRSSSSNNNNNGGSSGGLDDRFDMWFYNSNIQNATEKVNYNINTYETWGSNGVPWNGRATQGNSPIDLEIELMSDHYPVYMQLHLDAPSTICTPSCPVTVHYSTPVADGVYNASVSITSDAVIGAAQNVTFYGGDFVELQPGFEVKAGGEFLGDIQTCN